MTKPWKVSFKWVDGNAVFYDEAGDEIFTVDGTNRKITIPVGSGLVNEGDSIVVTEPDDVTIEVNGGVLKVVDESIGEDQVTVAYAALLALIAAIPTVDPEDGVTCYFDNGVLKVASAT